MGMSAVLEFADQRVEFLRRHRPHELGLKPATPDTIKQRLLDLELYAACAEIGLYLCAANDRLCQSATVAGDQLMVAMELFANEASGVASSPEMAPKLARCALRYIKRAFVHDSRGKADPDIEAAYKLAERSLQAIEGCGLSRSPLPTTLR